jgi:hypothetical protein
VLVGDRDQGFVIADPLQQVPDPSAQPIVARGCSPQCRLQVERAPWINKVRK